MFEPLTLCLDMLGMVKTWYVACGHSSHNGNPYNGSMISPYSIYGLMTIPKMGIQSNFGRKDTYAKRLLRWTYCSKLNASYPQPPARSTGQSKAVLMTLFMYVCTVCASARVFDSCM